MTGLMILKLENVLNGVFHGVNGVFYQINNRHTTTREASREINAGRKRPLAPIKLLLERPLATVKLLRERPLATVKLLPQSGFP